MNIELTPEQSEILAGENGAPVVVDPGTRRTYRLVGEEVYQQWQARAYDPSPWTATEMAVLAGRAFEKLDDDDYSHYLRETP